MQNTNSILTPDVVKYKQSTKENGPWVVTTQTTTRIDGSKTQLLTISIKNHD